MLSMMCLTMMRLTTMRLTTIRSMTHPYPIHGVAYATTGVPAIDVGMELAPNDLRHAPYFGSAFEYFDRKQRTGAELFPQNVALPFHMSSQRTGEVYRAGPYAAYLGSTYNPIWTEYIGKATRCADYSVWLGSLGQTGSGLAADGNNNNIVDQADYDVWKTQFGQPAGAGAASVARSD